LADRVFEIGDLVIPRESALALSQRESDEFGIVVKIHKPFTHPKIKIFYWVLWTGTKRSYVHFDHELTLLERGRK
jgi:hypothetical protein